MSGGPWTVCVNGTTQGVKERGPEESVRLGSQLVAWRGWVLSWPRAISPLSFIGGGVVDIFYSI